VKLKFPEWPHATTDMMFLTNNIDDWTTAMIESYAQWCAEHRIEVPHIIAIRRLRSPLAKKPPSRPKGSSLRAYRRLLRRWRIDLAGGVRSDRRKKAEEKLKRQRWGVWVKQGLPLRDPEAALWYMETHLLYERCPTYGSDLSPLVDNKGKTFRYRGYLNEHQLTAICGGVLPAGIDYADEFRTRFKVGSIPNRRQGTKPFVPPRLAGDPKRRWNDSIVHSAAAEYREAKFRHRHSLDLSVLLLTEGAPHAGCYDDQPNRGRRRRGGRNTNVSLSIRRSWWRLVFKPGLARIFGPRTFVLDTWFENGVQKFRVYRQPSEHRYQTETVVGTLGRAADGSAILKEV